MTVRFLDVKVLDGSLEVSMFLPSGKVVTILGIWLSFDYSSTSQVASSLGQNPDII